MSDSNYATDISRRVVKNIKKIEEIIDRKDALIMSLTKTHTFQKQEIYIRLYAMQRFIETSKINRDDKKDLYAYISLIISIFADKNDGY